MIDEPVAGGDVGFKHDVGEGFDGGAAALWAGRRGEAGLAQGTVDSGGVGFGEIVVKSAPGVAAGRTKPARVGIIDDITADGQEALGAGVHEFPARARQAVGDGDTGALAASRTGRASHLGALYTF